MTTLSTKILTVSELTQAIKAHLEPKFFHILLKGEITNFTKQASGHLYFNLKDASTYFSIQHVAWDQAKNFHFYLTHFKHCLFLSETVFF